MVKHRIVKSGFKAAWSHKLRALFMIGSVMIGIAALTITMSLGEGAQNEMLARIQKLFSSNTIMVMSGNARMEGTQTRMSPAATLKVADIEDIAGRTENILNWDAMQIALDQPATTEGKNAIVNIYGQTPSAEGVWNLVITGGRFFTDGENRSFARVAVIAPNVRKELFGDVDPVGKQVEINNTPYQVIGTIGPRGLDPHGINLDDDIIVPLNTLLNRVMNVDYIMLAKFQIADRSRLKETAGLIGQALRERHHIAQGENEDFIVATPEFVENMIDRMNSAFSRYLPMIAIISLLVGGVVVANLMVLSVSERKKEIGLRKAVGATSRNILFQFLLEASSITVFGGIVGLALGILLLLQITQMMHLPFTVSWTGLGASVLLSTAIGIVAGLLPAKRAAALQPAETLR